MPRAEHKLIIKFSGQNADDHSIPAYEAMYSLQGITRSLAIISHYVTKQEIRRRYPFKGDINFFLKAPPRQGSLEVIIAGVVGGIAGGFLSALGEDVYTQFKTLTKHCLNTAVGEPSTLPELEPLTLGEIEALTRAIEKPVEYSHKIIGFGANDIKIISDETDELTAYNALTKEYISDSFLDSETVWEEATITALNVNSGHGLAYIHNLNHNVSFSIAEHTSIGTKETLSQSLRNYAHRRGSEISINFTRVLSNNGRLKRIIIHQARNPIAPQLP